jgi:hypothetical protein
MDQESADRLLGDMEKEVQRKEENWKDTVGTSQGRLHMRRWRDRKDIVKRMHGRLEGEWQDIGGRLWGNSQAII